MEPKQSIFLFIMSGNYYLEMSGYKNRANKNSNYNNISYNNDNVIITISRCIQNSGIVRTLYSGVFRYIQGHSAIFSHGHAY